ncbi:MAG: outer membrane lipoprotein-sorting protein, partial [Bacteroidales bacterium]|nr:outer membrane lipoprotein-sorting protein [Bacteroidales bacterium]
MNKMKHFIAVLILIFPAWLMAQELTAIEIVKKADDKMRGMSSVGEMTMQIVRPSWTRTITMKTWTKSDQFSLVLITAPAKEKGQVFLKREKEMWNWLPSIERMVKIPPSMMMQGWMGSDFTNDDLVKQSSIVKDYQHTLLETEVVRSQNCYKIELIAKEDAAVAWGKIISWIT